MLGTLISLLNRLPPFSSEKRGLFLAEHPLLRGDFWSNRLLQAEKFADRDERITSLRREIVGMRLNPVFEYSIQKILFFLHNCLALL